MTDIETRIAYLENVVRRIIGTINKINSTNKYTSDFIEDLDKRVSYIEGLED